MYNLKVYEGYKITMVEKINTQSNNYLHYVETGNPDSLSPTVILCHGWPDDELLWKSMTKQGLSDTYYCCALRLPNSGESGNNGIPATFNEIVFLVYRTIKLIQQRRGRCHDKVILVGHDWGAYLAYLFERDYPECVDRLVTIDVGYDFSFNLLDTIITLMYQWYLAFSFMVGLIFPRIGTQLVRLFASACQHGEGTPTPLNRIYCNSAQYYAYFHLAYWFSPAVNPLSPLLDNYKPRCPLLYLYPTGNRGLTPTFHSQSMLKQIKERRDGSNAVEIKNAGHWVVYHQAKRCTTEIVNWLKK